MSDLGNSKRAGLHPGFNRTPSCLSLSVIRRMSEKGDPCPEGFREHVDSCAHCASMIKATSRLYEERQIWKPGEKRGEAEVVVFVDIRRVWPPDVLRLAAGPTGAVWKARIALPPIVFPGRNLRIELDVFPMGLPSRETTQEPNPVPPEVKLQVTATTLAGESLENLSLTVRLGDEPVVSGRTDNEGAITSDVLGGERLLSEPLTVEVQDGPGGTGQHSP